MLNSVQPTVLAEQLLRDLGGQLAQLVSQLDVSVPFFLERFSESFGALVDLFNEGAVFSLDLLEPLHFEHELELQLVDCAVDRLFIRRNRFVRRKRRVQLRDFLDLVVVLGQLRGHRVQVVDVDVLFGKVAHEVRAQRKFAQKAEKYDQPLPLARVHDGAARYEVLWNAALLLQLRQQRQACFLEPAGVFLGARRVETEELLEVVLVAKHLKQMEHDEKEGLGVIPIEAPLAELDLLLSLDFAEVHAHQLEVQQHVGFVVARGQAAPAFMQECVSRIHGAMPVKISGSSVCSAIRLDPIVDLMADLGVDTL